MFDYSIVIRTLGNTGEKYRTMLNAIERQTVKPKEIIVAIPDGYTLDHTLGYERIVRCNKGMVTQRAAGIEAAQGEYLLVFDEAGGFPTNIKLGEDFILWLKVALNNKVVLLNKPLANYNQDVDVTYRGTHHLHEPQKHMLWQLEEYKHLEKTNNEYKQLIDNLRTYSLMNYLLDRHYRDAARKELAKVDWTRQPVATCRLYRLPIWVLCLRNTCLRFGSKIKKCLS